MIFRFDGQEPVIGEGTYVAENATVIGSVTIGKGCYIGPGAIIRGDYGQIIIGDGTAVEEGVIIHAPPGKVNTIGSHVTFGHGATIHSELIEDWVVVGMNAVTSIDAKIGRWAIVGEGAIVKQGGTVEPGMVVVGAPAKPVRPVSEKDIQWWEYAKQLYVDLAAKYLTPGMLERID